MANDIYLQLGIDSSKLKRDYIKYPLKLIKGKKNTDKPYKEDLEYLYLDCNLSVKEISNYFKISISPLFNWLKYYNIKKNKEQIQQIFEKNMIKKYGVSNPSYIKFVVEKRKNTSYLNYGVKCPFQNEIIKKKIKQTKIERYGNENYTNREKYKQTNLERYDVEYISQLKEVQEKIYNTKKKNHTFGKSKEEDEIYNLLCYKYKKVKRQYKEVRYPFNCDFYIPENDLFIEYQGYFTHGKEPYTGTKKQKETIKLWESKNTSQYKKAINDWTIKDPLKRKTAKENKLNYLEFFNLDEFMGWYNKQ